LKCDRLSSLHIQNVIDTDFWDIELFHINATSSGFITYKLLRRETRMMRKSQKRKMPLFSLSTFQLSTYNIQRIVRMYYHICISADYVSMCMSMCCI